MFKPGLGLGRSPAGHRACLQREGLGALVPALHMLKHQSSAGVSKLSSDRLVVKGTTTGISSRLDAFTSICPGEIITGVNWMFSSNSG